MITESSLSANGILLLYTFSSGSAWFTFFHRRGGTLAESAAFGLMSTIMVQSWTGQVLLYLGWTLLYLPMLLLASALFIKIGIDQRRYLARQLRTFIQFNRHHQVAATGLLLVSGYTVVVCIWPLSPFDQKALPAYQLLWDRTGSIFRIWHSVPDMVLPVLNHTLFLAPWQPSHTIALANIGAYAAIGFSTYALARRYAWPPMAITVTLLVISMQRIVYQSMSAPSELLPAAAALISILALYRMCEQFHGRDGVMLLMAIFFSVSGGRLCYLMPAILCALSLAVLGRRYGRALWRQFAPKRWGALLVLSIMGGIVFSQLGVIMANVAMGKPWIGETVHHRLVFNSDAHWGLLGNMARYLLLAFDLPAAVDRFVAWGFGVSLLEGLKGFYAWAIALPLGSQGLAETFDWGWSPDRDLAWFGPTGFLLVMPSVVVALVRGPRRLKTTALAMAAYWLLIALTIAWQPGNVRLMTCFFVCSGFFIAFLLPPWRVGATGQMVLQVFSILLIVHALLA